MSPPGWVPARRVGRTGRDEGCGFYMDQPTDWLLEGVNLRYARACEAPL